MKSAGTTHGGQSLDAGMTVNASVGCVTLVTVTSDTISSAVSNTALPQIATQLNFDTRP
jgi:hypothetical protein